MTFSIADTLHVEQGRQAAAITNSGDRFNVAPSDQFLVRAINARSAAGLTAATPWGGR
jgi:hypothetical protein